MSASRSVLATGNRLATFFRILLSRRHGGLWRCCGPIFGLLIVAGGQPPVRASEARLLQSVPTTGTRGGDRVKNYSRIALVVGETAYTRVPLRNPANDARAMARMLGALGFDVTLVINVTHDSMKKEILAFGEKIQSDTGGTALFYYAGHGVQAGGVNYLVPIGENIRRQADLQFEAVDMKLVLSQFENAPDSTNLVILDACRNNPFSSSRSAAVGLATVGAPQGTLVAYATAPDSVASDGSGPNGVYTYALLQYMPEPELPVERVFKRVRLAVIGATAGAQVPWEVTSLTSEFYFARGKVRFAGDSGYVPPVGGLRTLIDDDFTSDHMLFTGVNGVCSFAYRPGSYVLVNTSANRGCWMLYPHELPSRVRIETGTHILHGDPGARLSLFIGSSEEAAYNFALGGDGHFYVERYTAGAWHQLIAPTPRREIHVGENAINQLAVEIDRRHLTFAINEVNVGSYDAPQDVQGQVGFGVGPGTSVAFDFLRVRALPLARMDR